MVTKAPDEREFEFSVEWVNFPEKFRLHNNFASQIQKHIINGEDIDLTKEKWIDGFYFKITGGVPQLEVDKSKNIKYLIE
ncbi:hypothetical protein [Chryseobacterium sp. BIGb0232]|uniref:hypothetical protein n=1 Tax=Chryseobacterium sp. BIGb0232 TaxID=2940598 RepID=UPI000F48C010|nr:hypothetical protein [Chryseobacterium sp. BIGb0232]MCS4300633.1 hypothetical protein [Chryseobacterium sp. BIGb0232]ROS20482.1 hypothetical protein EDF65_1206 [Chryseobacterium nakagawai]